MEFIQTEQLYGARVFLEVLRRVTVEVYEGGQSPHPIQENRILGSIDRHLLKRTATARCDARWYGTARRIASSSEVRVHRVHRMRARGSGALMGQDGTGLLLFLLDERRAPFLLFGFEEHRVFVEREESLVEGL
eukprot:1277325-Prymnesium_polylepis.1